ncbi:STAS domain-containing protein [Paucibacter sp. B2R-40]|uniref:STAS domain-containing protein n=1 Tax=Paucibacter sp. B2R-40 TaxID=2893554 RepID=UPI0021E4F8C6|nr:STAS domain-containing protein [Paucibacter sp. B2R-40]MCV2354733.1 STAS domain-containing protein [Paucibacter sp. B2R-40]
MPDSIVEGDDVDLAPVLCLALGPELTIAQAADTHALLLETLSRLDGRQLSLDLSGVSDFDSSAVQLLLATQRSMRERAAQLTLQDPSAVVLAALRCYGLDAEMKAFRPANEAEVGEASEELPCQ